MPVAAVHGTLHLASLEWACGRYVVLAAALSVSHGLLEPMTNAALVLAFLIGSDVAVRYLAASASTITTEADSSLGGLMHPWTLSFVDSKIESEYTIRVFEEHAVDIVVLCIVLTIAVLGLWCVFPETRLNVTLAVLCFGSACTMRLYARSAANQAWMLVVFEWTWAAVWLGFHVVRTACYGPLQGLSGGAITSLAVLICYSHVYYHQTLPRHAPPD